MSLTPGAKIGIYEIVSKLGEGGPAFARASRELRRGLAVAQARIWS